MIHVSTEGALREVLGEPRVLAASRSTPRTRKKPVATKGLKRRAKPKGGHASVIFPTVALAADRFWPRATP